jgi:hypothetical protein
METRKKYKAVEKKVEEEFEPRDFGRPRGRRRF